MDISERIFCHSHYRHLRLLFFVDSTISAQFLTKLFIDNYLKWGGRYNPVIPVYNGDVTPYYRNYLNSYDPDIVLYSSDVGVAHVYQFCKDLHPREFIQLDPNGRNNLSGVYTMYLLPEALRQTNRSLQRFSLVYFNHHIDEPQTSFYNLSFGLRNQYHEDILLGRGYPTTMLDVTNIGDTNRQLAEMRPFYHCLLAELQLEITLFRPTSDWEFHCFEFIIYDAVNAFEDLIYFWNRQQHQRPEGRIQQIIASTDQLQMLMADENFGHLLNTLRGDSDVYLHSLSLVGNELETLMNELRQTYPRVPFRLVEDRTIPRTMGNEGFPYEREIQKQKNMLLGKKDYLRLPAPVWNPDLPVVRGYYVYDVDFFEEGEYVVNKIKLPYGLVTDFLSENRTSRVNKVHGASFVMTAESRGLDIRLPTASDIFQNRLRMRVENGALVSIPIDYLRPSDAGLKLASFVALFDQKINAASEIVQEKFWIDLILGNSTGDIKKSFAFNRTKNTLEGPVNEVFTKNTPKSNILNYNGVFSYEDLEAERWLIYLEHKDNIKEGVTAHGLNMTDDELIEYLLRSMREDFELQIDPDLQYMVNRDALFIGMKVKCSYCGSNVFYPLSELKNKMPCKGCLQIIVPKVKSSFYYKFNDTIYNNISSDPVKRSKAFNGNYIVLRTLGAFSPHHSSQEGFHWSPSMDVGIRHRQTVVNTDIDILMLQNGKLIMGEAKADASEFKPGVLYNIKLMATTFRPDKIILAFKSGNIPAERIAVLTNFLKTLNCELIIHRVNAPNYFFGRLH